MQGGNAARYTLLPDYSTYQPASPTGAHSRALSASEGTDSFSTHSSSSPTGAHSPTASSSGSSSGTRTARSSCCGDGVVEIALVLRAAGAQELGGGEVQGDTGVELGQPGCKGGSKGGVEVL